MLFTVEICDSRGATVDRLMLDTAGYKLLISSEPTYGRTKKSVAGRQKYISANDISKWLQEEGIYHEYKVVHHQTFRKDGFEIKVPSIIKIVTEVPDDRPLPEQPEPSSLAYLRFFAKYYPFGR